MGKNILEKLLAEYDQNIDGILKEYGFDEIAGVFVMVSWMRNTAIDINNIGREYNHREHRGTQRIGLTTLCSLCPLWLNPVAFTACVGSIRPQQIAGVFRFLSCMARLGSGLKQ